MPSNDDNLFKPLSAKVGRRRFTSGGREIEAGRGRMGDGNRVRQVLMRKQRDADLRAKGAKA